MRRFMYSFLFALFCMFTGALSQPVLAASREIHAHSAAGTRSSFQVREGAYRSYGIVRIGLYTYIKMRIGFKGGGKASSDNSDSFFYALVSSNGAE